MGEQPADKNKPEPPKPEVLKPQSDTPATTEVQASNMVAGRAGKNFRRGSTYRPSHKATFIGIAVVVAILVVNVAVISFVLKSHAKTDTSLNQEQVTVSQEALNKLGVNRTGASDDGVVLTIGPSAQFNSKVKIGGDVSVGGQLILNSKFSATDASLAQLEAGNTALAQLNVNGNTTLSGVALRNDLNVSGISRFQGAVTMTQLLTVNNNVNVSGSLAVGGALLVNSFHASNLTVDGTTTLGGHVITRGSSPDVSAGSAVGTSGTVSISGNDTAGTVAVNAGGGAGNGIAANITFANKYGNTPHVVVTAIGPGVTSYYVNRSANGFSIGINGSMTAGGHAFDYIVEQ